MQYISVVYITSVNSTRLNFFALAEKTQASSDKSFSSKNIEKTVVCDATGVNSLSIRILLPLSWTSSVSPFVYSSGSSNIFAAKIHYYFLCEGSPKTQKPLKHNLNSMIADGRVTSDPQK